MSSFTNNTNIKLIDIPSWLHNSILFKLIIDNSTDNDDNNNNFIIVPHGVIIDLNQIIDNMDDFINILKAYTYWGTEIMPHELFNFIDLHINNRDIMTYITKYLNDYSHNGEFNILIAYINGYKFSNTNTELYDIQNHILTHSFAYQFIYENYINKMKLNGTKTINKFSDVSRWLRDSKRYNYLVTSEWYKNKYYNESLSNFEIRWMNEQLSNPLIIPAIFAIDKCYEPNNIYDFTICMCSCTYWDINDEPSYLYGYSVKLYDECNIYILTIERFIFYFYYEKIFEKQYNNGNIPSYFMQPHSRYSF
jgi:hypothetical protein